MCPTFPDFVLDTALRIGYTIRMNETKQCVECGETEVYLIDDEVCQDCEEALYDDAY